MVSGSCSCSAIRALRENRRQDSASLRGVSSCSPARQCILSSQKRTIVSQSSSLNSPPKDIQNYLTMTHGNTLLCHLPINPPVPILSTFKVFADVHRPPLPPQGPPPPISFAPSQHTPSSLLLPPECSHEYLLSQQCPPDPSLSDASVPSPVPLSIPPDFSPTYLTAISASFEQCPYSFTIYRYTAIHSISPPP